MSNLKNNTLVQFHVPGKSLSDEEVKRISVRAKTLVKVYLIVAVMTTINYIGKSQYRIHFEGIRVFPNISR
jgi:hypothetical protein